MVPITGRRVGRSNRCPNDDHQDRRILLEEEHSTSAPPAPSIDATPDPPSSWRGEGNSRVSCDAVVAPSGNPDSLATRHQKEIHDVTYR